jgi:hypothetical protein
MSVLKKSLARSDSELLNAWKKTSYIKEDPIMSKKKLKDIETQAMIDKWQEELARHVAYLPILCEQAGVDEHELHRAIEIHFYVRSMSKGAMQ